VSRRAVARSRVRRLGVGLRIRLGKCGVHVDSMWTPRGLHTNWGFLVPN
jgi:hypothetical protein